MKIKNLVVIALLSLLFQSCSTIVENTPKKDPFLMEGKKKIQNSLKEKLDFKELIIGFYETKKNMKTEKGVNLTFKIEDFEKMNDSLISQYSNIITEEVKNNIDERANYNFVKILFQEEVKENNITKTKTYTLKRTLN